MAGAKGRSGGPRANAGGSRPGAGRKPRAESESANSAVAVGLEPQAHGGALKREKAVPVPAPEGTDMLTFLQEVALGLRDASTTQVRAAIAAVQYTHTKRADGGKKEEVQAAAAKAGAGRFGLRAVK